jgi:hypothetical protein
MHHAQTLYLLVVAINAVIGWGIGLENVIDDDR